MKRILCAAALAAFALPVFATDVGVSISIGQPGFYGEINIGGYPRPPVIYSQPIVVERVHRDVVVEPIYLRVPPGYAKHWHKYCHKYRACGRPVYFVRDDWYRDVYVPRYRARHEHYRRDDRYGHDRHYRDDRHDDRHDDRGHKRDHH